MKLSAVFLHLSDIHFGQERGGKLIVHNDVKESLIDDVKKYVTEQFRRPINGILVSGDIAYSGQPAEFQEAGRWLDRLTEAGGCKQTDVQVVPGNHDIDRNEVTEAARMMLKQIGQDGDVALDRCLEREEDRETLYGRLHAYRSFAQGYGCELDLTGGSAGEKFLIDLSPNRSMRFLGLNSAIACSKEDKEGKLTLGARQRVLRHSPGEALVIICHHPLNWFKDSTDAARYLKRSACVFISGHEHMPSVELVGKKGESQVLKIASGATIPPSVEDPYNFMYNFLEFSLDPSENSLAVDIHPRAWKDELKVFAKDDAKAGKHQNLVVPFKEMVELAPSVIRQIENQTKSEVTDVDNTGDEPAMVDNPNVEKITLHFFRDLSPTGRKEVLTEFGVLPSSWPGALTHSVETALLKNLLCSKPGSEVETAISNRATRK